MPIVRRPARWFNHRRAADEAAVLTALLVAALPMALQQLGEAYRQRREHAHQRAQQAAEERVARLEARVAALEARLGNVSQEQT